MKNSTRKVVILENITSPYIQQAIIVLKDYNPLFENKALFDAEKVVNDYLQKNGYISAAPTKKYTTRKERNKKKLFMTFMLVSIITAIWLCTALK